MLLSLGKDLNWVFNLTGHHFPHGFPAGDHELIDDSPHDGDGLHRFSARINYVHPNISHSHEDGPVEIVSRRQDPRPGKH